MRSLTGHSLSSLIPRHVAGCVGRVDQHLEIRHVGLTIYQKLADDNPAVT